MDDYDVQTILAVLFLAVLTVAAFPGKFIGLVAYTASLLLVLGYFGIQALRLIGIAVKSGLKTRELLPGILTNQEIVGITGIVSISWLFMNFVMPYEQYMALLTMILAALGIPLIVSHLASK